jgi:hypothetical protein
MERIVAGGNLNAPWKQVQHNKGCPGIDGMTVAEPPAYLAEQRPRRRAQWLAGTHRPMPVRGGGDTETDRRSPKAWDSPGA